MKKILVVDDRETNRNLLCQMMSRVGDYQLIEASNGVEALSLFGKEEPDLILMDINMPDMDGYQTASAIKALTGENYIPIIFVTAMSSDTYLKDALDSGGDDFISKPINFEVLESKINAHLRIQDLNQQLNSNNQQLKYLNQHLNHEQELIEHFFDRAIEKSFLDPRIIKYNMSPMSAFTGDLFLVARGTEGGLYLVIGDFTGHGLTAAMGTLPVAMIFLK